MLTTLEGHTDEVNSVAWSSSGSMLASGSDDNTLRLWDTKSGEMLESIESPTDCLAWSPSGNMLASGSWWEETIRLWLVL